MKLRHLEMALQRCSGFSRPKASLEQYSTPAVVAARLLYHANLQGDIVNRSVLDLGCGTGILACGAALLGAAPVAGIDIDAGAIAVAKRNAELLQVSVDFVRGDIADDSVFHALCPRDTIIMNPPFGAQVRHADRPFIDRALACGAIVYAILNAGTRPFLEKYLRGRGLVDQAVACTFPMRRSFSHHTRDSRDIPVEIVRILRSGEASR
ncbi:MAG: methyltransferase [Methanomicrobiales archaeon]|nr:methyltransferase [Methanomicrobiales archaeon]